MADSRIVIYPGQIKALEGHPAVRAAVRRDSERMADEAAAGAPKDTGAGAASIHSEPDPTNPFGRRVGWDQDHYYMIFQEAGFEGHPGAHFLRRTFESYIHI